MDASDAAFAGGEVVDGRVLAQSSVGVSADGKVFVKKACVAALQRVSPRNPEAKWRVTQASFANEFRFCGDARVGEALRLAGCRVPAVLKVHVDGPLDAFESTFRLATERLDIGPLEPPAAAAAAVPSAFVEKPAFDHRDARSVVRWLAKFHALFWDRTGEFAFLERGGWWRKPLRPTVKWHALQPTLAHLVREFPAEFAPLDVQANHAALLGLAEIAADDGFVRHGLGPARTFVHGDVKSSNFFFDRHDPEWASVAIDFQWVGGAGSGAADLVYLIHGSVLCNVEESAPCEAFFQEMKRFETELLNEYYAMFAHELGRTSRPPPSREFLQVQFDIELLEYFTTAAPYLLADLKPKTVIKNRAKYGYLTYERDVRATAYFFAQALRAFEQHRARLVG